MAEHRVEALVREVTELIDVVGKPTTRIDFSEPVQGMEAPWGMAQFVFVYDSAVLPDPPRSIPALLEWAKSNSGRFTPIRSHRTFWARPF